MSKPRNSTRQRISSSQSNRTQSWIKPQIGWAEIPSCFAIKVPLGDPDLLELVGTGQLKVQYFPRRSAPSIALCSRSDQPLYAALIEATWVHGKLRSPIRLSPAPEFLIAYCWGVTYLPDEDRLSVIVGATPRQIGSAWISSSVATKARDLWLRHQDTVKKWEAVQQCKRAESNALAGRLQHEERERLSRASNVGESMYGERRPRANAQELVSLLPVGVAIPARTALPGRLCAAAAVALADTKIDPPRCGELEGLLVRGTVSPRELILTWEPRGPLPPYPELRAALQSLLPKALLRPRRSDISPPDFAGQTGTDFISRTIGAVSAIEVPASVDALAPFEFRASEIRTRSARGREFLREGGFEALGWYQSFHCWSEESWGIYLDAEALESFACMLHDDLRQVGESSPQLALLIAINLVYQHELFHARVEAYLTWLELSARQPRHLRYKQQVYSVAVNTDELLEEALANWWSWHWFKTQLASLKASGFLFNEQEVERIVVQALDLSPPGYRNWRAGDKRDAWRAFAAELSVGKLVDSQLKKVPPLESVLRDPLPFDFRPSDVPTFIIGRGLIADCLLSAPATFGTPTRREIERALKHFGYSVDTRRGKGSHEMWTGQDGRGFPIPRRDPLSRGVFAGFLHHVGIDKTTYVGKIRPLL